MAFLGHQEFNNDVCVVIFLISAISLLIASINIIICNYSSTSHQNQSSLLCVQYWVAIPLGIIPWSSKMYLIR